MGGALLQHCNRDTLKFAMKCSAMKNDEGWFDVYKDPVTDPGKASKRGRFAVNAKGETVPYGLSDEENLLKEKYDESFGKTVFYTESFRDLRERAKV